SPTATGDWEDARTEFLEVLIGCALEEGDYVMDPNHVDYYVGWVPVYKKYFGEIGIAPGWTSRGLTLTEKRYITACVMQRVNRFGASVDILLESSTIYRPLNPSEEWL